MNVKSIYSNFIYLFIVKSNIFYNLWKLMAGSVVIENSISE